MTRRALLAALALALLPRASAADEWTAADTAWEAAFVGAVFLDWQQTRWFLYEQRPHRYYEINPVIGKHPSSARLNAHVAAAVIGHAVVARILPASWRRTWQVMTVSVELAVVARNADLDGVGVRVSVPWW